MADAAAGVAGAGGAAAAGASAAAGAGFDGSAVGGCGGVGVVGCGGIGEATSSGGPPKIASKSRGVAPPSGCEGVEVVGDAPDSGATGDEDDVAADGAAAGVALVSDVDPDGGAAGEVPDDDGALGAEPPDPLSEEPDPLPSGPTEAK